MAKKNPYVFTIGFDKTDPVHVRAAEILNGTKKKAHLIAAAVLSYVDNGKIVNTPEFDLEVFQPLLQQLIQKELKKMSKSRGLPESQENCFLERTNDPEQVLNLSSEEIPMDEGITRNIVDAIDVFRRM